MNSEHITEIDEIADKLVLAKLLENDAKAALRKLLQDVGRAAKPDNQWRDMDSAPRPSRHESPTTILITLEWDGPTVNGNRIRPQKIVIGSYGLECLYIHYPNGENAPLSRQCALDGNNYTAVGWMPLPEPRKKAE